MKGCPDEQYTQHPTEEARSTQRDDRGKQSRLSSATSDPEDNNRQDGADRQAGSAVTGH